jgi:glycosyltransferase involved in cell wall biosynthesis
VISLIIPAHNEEERLAATLHEYAGALQGRYTEDYEVLVVANACTDATVEVARTAAAVNPHIRVLEIPDAIGKGGAVLAGFLEARGESVLFADADAATSPTSLLALVEGLNLHHVVIGSRKLPASQVLTKQPLKRRLLSRVFGASVRTLYGLPYRDTQCGAKAFRGDAARALARCVEERHWAFDVDLLLCARAMGLRVAEQPVVWEDKAGSKLRVGSTGLQVLASLWRMTRRHSSQPMDRPNVFVPEVS